MLLKNVKNNYYLLSLLGGSLYALGFPSKLIPPIFVLSLFGSYLFLRSLFKQTGLKKNILSLLLFSLGFNLTGFYWIANTIEVFGNLNYPLSLMLSLLFSLIIVPHLWIFVFIKNFIMKKKIPTLYLVPTLAFIMTLLEYFTPAQFPTSLGQIYIQLNELVTIAHLGGVPVYSFISFFMIFSLIFKSNKMSSLFSLTALVFISFLMKIKNTPIDTLNIKIVQANVGNFMKVSSESGDKNSMSEIFNRYKFLSQNNPNNKTFDLIVWPETAYPNTISPSFAVQEKISPEIIRSITEYTDTPMLIGGYSKDDFNESFFESEYNSAFLFDKNGDLKNHYNKMVLIPFGETLPFPAPVKEKLSRVITNVSYFATGQSYTQFSLENEYRFITPICYELLKPTFLRTFLNKQVKPTHFMLNLTNDSWYGDTAEPEQHLFLSRWRAVEFNLPIIRSTNTGITTLIKADGSTGERLEVGAEATLEVSMDIYKNEPTFYQRFGFLFSFLIFLMSLFFSWFESRLLLNRVDGQLP